MNSSRAASAGWFARTGNLEIMSNRAGMNTAAHSAPASDFPRLETVSVRLPDAVQQHRDKNHRGQHEPVEVRIGIHDDEAPFPSFPRRKPTDSLSQRASSGHIRVKVARARHPIL